MEPMKVFVSFTTMEIINMELIAISSALAESTKFTMPNRNWKIED